MKTHFALKIKVIGVQNLDFLQKTLKTYHGMAGPIFELHPSNLVRIHIFPSCKNAENFVTKSQVVLELAKISVSVPSIS